MKVRYCIHVPSETDNRGLEALLPILEGVMPVKWIRSSGPEQIDGNLVLLSAGQASRGDFSALSPQFPSLSLPNEEMVEAGGSELISLGVTFSDLPEVPFPFRGRSIRAQVATRPIILTPGQDEKVLAESEEGPVWVLSNKGNVNHYRSGFALPALPQGRLLEVLSGRRFLEMLPLIHFLTEIEQGKDDYAIIDRPILASFIFDDPNLHWPHYGYVNYRAVAESAREHNYHVSFAAIPLDTWFTHRGTAAIFRKHKERLSLLIHGNNHTSRELAQPGTHAERLSLLGEALRRIERLERQSGLEVSRVMVPPHGACSEEMLAALATSPFKAMCLSHAGLSAYNKAKDWTRFVGYLPFEFVQGSPVLPRWSFSAPELENTVLLAVYLKQAVILYGHHQDLKNGLGVLEKAADFINSLGSPVEWLELGAIAHSHYLERELIRRGVAAEGSGFKSSSSAGVERSAHRRSIKEKAAPFIRRVLTEGRDRLLAVGR